MNSKRKLLKYSIAIVLLIPCIAFLGLLILSIARGEITMHRGFVQPHTFTLRYTPGFFWGFFSVNLLVLGIFIFALIKTIQVKD